MRFVIICLMSLFLVPVLASEQQRSPSSPPPPYQRHPSQAPPYRGHPPPYREHPPPYLEHPPPPPEHPAPPRHGDTVRYQGPDGPHGGIALGTRPDRQGHHRLAPFGRRPQGQHFVHKDRIVKAHSGDIVTNRGKSAPLLASMVTERHGQVQSRVSYASGPVQGSPNYISEHGGRHNPGGSGGHGRN